MENIAEVHAFLQEKITECIAEQIVDELGPQVSSRQSVQDLGGCVHVDPSSSIAAPISQTNIPPCIFSFVFRSSSHQPSAPQHDQHKYHHSKSKITAPQTRACLRVCLATDRTSFSPTLSPFLPSSLPPPLHLSTFLPPSLHIPLPSSNLSTASLRTNRSLHTSFSFLVSHSSQYGKMYSTNKGCCWTEMRRGRRSSKKTWAEKIQESTGTNAVERNRQSRNKHERGERRQRRRPRGD